MMLVEKAIIPAQPGTYALLLHSEKPARLKVGSLGVLRVEPGWYVYVGSALGPGGLCGRLNHHLKQPSHPHWHVDYVRSVMEIIEIWYTVSDKRLECEWAQQFGTHANVTIPLKKFGASDCNCLAHLFYGEYERLQAKLMFGDAATHQVTVTGREMIGNRSSSSPTH